MSEATVPVARFMTRDRTKPAKADITIRIRVYAAEGNILRDEEKLVRWAGHIAAAAASYDRLVKLAQERRERVGVD